MTRYGILVAAGAIVAALTVLYWLGLGYRPLEAVAVEPPAGEYEEGEEAHYVLRLENTGAVPVTVTGINLTSEGRPLLVRTEARLGETLQGSEPFESFRIGEGEQRSVVVVGRFANCEQYLYGTKTRREVQLVRYRVLGVVPTDQEVRLPEPIEVAAPPDDRCASR